MKTICLSIFLLVSSAATAVMAQPGQSEFVPVNELPAAEQLPAAPLVIAAYAFVWLAFLAYVFMTWRKVGKVEAEIGALSAQLAKRRP
jgi:CcmD family protein